jgi:GxxExxY protein
MFDLDAETEGLARQVIGAAIEVHRQLGPGFLESVYEKALSVELSIRGIPHVCQHLVRVQYKEVDVGEGRLDMWVANRIVLELKTVDQFAPIHEAITLAYLNAVDNELALMINFKVAVLKDGIRRVIRTRPHHSPASRPSLPSRLRG